VLGVVENMSGFTDPETGRRWDFFATGGGQRLAEELGVPLLGQVPLDPELAGLADRGQPLLVAGAGRPAAQVLTAIAAAIREQAEQTGIRLPTIQ
jgi:Flp pilus assembly CpaE family ATPase